MDTRREVISPSDPIGGSLCARRLPTSRESGGKPNLVNKILDESSLGVSKVPAEC